MPTEPAGTLVSREALGPAACVAMLLALAADGAAGQGAVSQEEALRLAFPEPAEIERRTAFLEAADLERASERAGPGVEVEEPVVTYYVGSRADSVLGVAYFDAHRVRTLPEVLMIVLDPAGTVDRVEVLKFDEPREYRPPEGWLDEFRGVGGPGAAGAPGDVVNITGATLTSGAVERAVRRTLALHDVVAPFGGGGDGSGGGDGPGGGGR